MSEITISEIGLRLAARKLGVKWQPLPVNSSPTRLDVENGFPDTVESDQKRIPAKPATKSFGSEPE